MLLLVPIVSETAVFFVLKSKFWESTVVRCVKVH
jgi:hypothetical protein